MRRAGRRLAARGLHSTADDTLQLGGTSTASGTNVQINLNGANPITGLSDAGSGILTIGNGATFNDQTTSSGLFIFASNREWRHGFDGGGEQRGHLYQERVGGDLDDQHDVQQYRHRERPERDAEPVGGGTDVGASLHRRRHGRTSAVARGRWTAIPASRETRPSAAGRRRSMEASGTGLLTVTGGTATFNGAVTTGALGAERRRAQWLWPR